MTEKDIIELIQKDPWMMKIILIASAQNLPDWLIGAGFVRNKVWDHLSGRKRETVDTNDIDLVYFDPKGNDKIADEALSKKLGQEMGILWEIKNQCYMHTKNNVPPFTSSEDAISQWPETQ